MRYQERMSSSPRRGGNSFTEAKQRYYPLREDDRSSDSNPYNQNSYHRDKETFHTHDGEQSRHGSSYHGHVARENRRNGIDDYASEAGPSYGSANLNRGYYSNSEYRREELDSHRHDSREAIFDEYQRYGKGHQEYEGRDYSEDDYHRHEGVSGNVEWRGDDEYSRRETNSRRHDGRQHSEEDNSGSMYPSSQRSYSERDDEDQSRSYRRRDKRKKSNTLHQLADLYEEVFSGRSISRSRSSSVSSGSYSSCEEFHINANCMNTLFNKDQEKSLDLIRCDKVGTSPNEVQLRMTLPLPMHLMENLDELVPTKSGLESAIENLRQNGDKIAKKCDLDYNRLEDQVILDEEFPGGVMPQFYKSLFEAPTDGSSDEEEDTSKHQGDVMNQVIGGYQDMDNHFEDRPGVLRNASLPTHIVIEEGASDVSSQASFGDMSFGKHVPKKKGHTEDKEAMDALSPRSRRSTQLSRHVDHMRKSSDEVHKFKNEMDCDASLSQPSFDNRLSAPALALEKQTFDTGPARLKRRQGERSLQSKFDQEAKSGTGSNRDWIPAKREQLDLVDQRYPSFDAPQDDPLKREIGTLGGNKNAHRRYPEMIDGIPTAIDYNLKGHERDLQVTYSDLTVEEGLAMDEYAVVRKLSLSNKSNEDEDPGHIPLRPAPTPRRADTSSEKIPMTESGDELMGQGRAMGNSLIVESELRKRVQNAGIKQPKMSTTQDEIMIPKLREGRLERNREDKLLGTRDELMGAGNENLNSRDEPTTTRSSRSIALRRERLRNARLGEEFIGATLQEETEAENMSRERNALMERKPCEAKDEIMNSKQEDEKDKNTVSKSEKDELMGAPKMEEEDEIMGSTRLKKKEKIFSVEADMQPEDELMGSVSRVQPSRKAVVKLGEHNDDEDELMGKMSSSISPKKAPLSDSSTGLDALSDSTKVVANVEKNAQAEENTSAGFLRVKGDKPGNLESMVDPATLEILKESDDFVSRLKNAAAARLDALDGKAGKPADTSNINVSSHTGFDKDKRAKEAMEGKEENTDSEEQVMESIAVVDKLGSSSSEKTTPNVSDGKVDVENDSEVNNSVGIMLSSYTVESFARYCKKLAEWDEDDIPEDDVDVAGECEEGSREELSVHDDEGEGAETETCQTMDQEENKITLLSEIDARSQAVEINYIGYKSMDKCQAPSSVSLAQSLEISPTTTTLETPLTFAHTSTTEDTPVKSPPSGGGGIYGYNYKSGPGQKKAERLQSNFYASHDEFDEDEYQFDKRLAKLSSLLPAATRAEKKTGTVAVTQIFVVEFWTKGLTAVFVFVVTWFNHLVSFRSRKNLAYNRKAGGPNFRALAVSGDIQTTRSKKIQGSTSYNHSLETDIDDGMSVSYVIPDVHDNDTKYSQVWKVTPSLGGDLRPKLGAQTYSNIRQTFSRSDARSVASMREWTARRDDQDMEFYEE